MNREAFFNSVRASLFNGNLTQPQVDGMNAILDGFGKRYPDGDPRWLAYYLATAKWETAGTMQPVREPFWLSENWRRLNLRYYPYYGRGYVQLTWKSNYQRQSQADRTGIDLVTNPTSRSSLRSPLKCFSSGWNMATTVAAELPTISTPPPKTRCTPAGW